MTGNVAPAEMASLSTPWRSHADAEAFRQKYLRLLPILHYTDSAVNPVPVKSLDPLPSRPPERRGTAGPGSAASGSRGRPLRGRRLRHMRPDSRRPRYDEQEKRALVDAISSEQMKGGATMPAVKRKVDPEEFILAALSPRERLEAALRLAGEAFEASALTAADIRAAARKVRRRLYAARQTKSPRRR